MVERGKTGRGPAVWRCQISQDSVMRLRQQVENRRSIAPPNAAIDHCDLCIANLVISEATELTRRAAGHSARHQVGDCDERDLVDALERGDTPQALAIDITGEVIGLQRSSA